MQSYRQIKISMTNASHLCNLNFGSSVTRIVQGLNLSETQHTQCTNSLNRQVNRKWLNMFPHGKQHTETNGIKLISNTGITFQKILYFPLIRSMLFQ